VTRFGTGRLTAWGVLIAFIIAGNYAAHFIGKTDNRALYKYGNAVGSLVIYGIWFAIAYAIASIDLDRLFALRAPRSRRTAAVLAPAIFVAILVVEAVVSVLPLPESPSSEQGIAPTHWEPRHAGAYAANFLVIVIAVPIVEELTFRGIGFGLLCDRYGPATAIAAIGILFGLAHGLLEGLLVLVPFGSALAYLRYRTDSTIPGMVVHGLFNAIALVYVILG
jgi:membrane protease YdiL (CAAX protease family)